MRKYWHPLDYMEKSPLHYDFDALGLRLVETRRRRISSADGVEHVYVYEGPVEESALTEMLGKYGMVKPSEHLSWSAPDFSRGYVHLIVEDGKSQVFHSISG